MTFSDYELPPSTLSKEPRIHESVWVADGARIVGDVELAEQSSVWYNAVLRGDINSIRIGKRSNVQDGCVIHLENNLPCIVGEDVTVGHQATLHACEVEDAVLIGMGAIILNGAKIGKGSIIAAGAVVLGNTVIPERSLVVGTPGKVVKTLDESIIDAHIKWAKKYVMLSQEYINKYR